MFARPLTKLVALTVFAIGLFAVSMAPYTNTKIWIDAVSGSTKIEKRSLWSEPSVALERSALRLWMESHGRNSDYHWTFLTSRTASVFGNVLGRGCSPAPPIYELRSVLAVYVANSSDDELAEFVNAMESDSKGRQDAVVAKACEESLRAMTTKACQSQ